MAAVSVKRSIALSNNSFFLNNLQYTIIDICVTDINEGIVYLSIF